MNRSLSEIKVIVLDAETTGLDTATDRILSLGGLKVEGNSIDLGQKFEAYLPTPDGHSASGAVAVHGIIPNSRRYNYVAEEKLLIDLLSYVDNSLIVGHHIGFDLQILNLALARNGAGPIVNRVVDTAKLSMRLRPAGYWSPKDDYSLDTLARRYRIPLSDRHTALGDCYITSILWLKLLTKLAVKLGRDLVLADVV